MISILASDDFLADVHSFLNTIYAETFETGFSTRSEVMIDRPLHCVYAVHDDRVIAAIAYSVSHHDQCAVIAIGGTDREFRGQGVYRDVKTRLEEVVREKGLIGIETLIHNDNTKMLSHAREDGYTTSYSSFYKKLRHDKPMTNVWLAGPDVDLERTRVFHVSSIQFNTFMFNRDLELDLPRTVRESILVSVFAISKSAQLTAYSINLGGARNFACIEILLSHRDALQCIKEIPGFLASLPECQIEEVTDPNQSQAQAYVYYDENRERQEKDHLYIAEKQTLTREAYDAGRPPERRRYDRAGARIDE